MSNEEKKYRDGKTRRFLTARDWSNWTGRYLYSAHVLTVAPARGPKSNDLLIDMEKAAAVAKRRRLEKGK